MSAAGLACLPLLLSGSPSHGDKKVVFDLQMMFILLRKEDIPAKRLCFILLIQLLLPMP